MSLKQIMQQITTLLHNTHTLIVTAIVLWWEIIHLFYYLFRGGSR